MNNPIQFIDPNGMWVSPIYDTEGNFLGTDEYGLQGSAWVLKKENFVQGMSEAEAAKYHTYTEGDPNYGFDSPEAAMKYANHFVNLPNRPDYDGFVTVNEGIAWAKQNPEALDNPTADNMLYLNTSKLDFGNISISDFGNGVGKPYPINLLNTGNLSASSGNVKLRGTVYALGRVEMELHDKLGTVSIVNDFNKSERANDYDWNPGGGPLRNSLIRAERARTGLNDNHGFRVYCYGKGLLNTKP